MEGKLYCIPCQDAHKMTDSCLQDVQCKLCSRKGHLRIDCPESDPHPAEQEAKHVTLAEYSNRQVAKRKSLVDTVDPPAKAPKYNACLFSSEDECQIDESVVIISDDEDIVPVEEFVQENKVKTDKVKLKTEEKKSPTLKEGDYHLVSIHIELFRSNKSTSSKLTQLGCTVHGSDSGSFFRGIKPQGLEKYLDNYKLGGDLLKALHLTREDDGTFLYRSRFEIVEDEKKIICVDEMRALVEFLEFLQDFPMCIFLGIDEDSVSILVKKLKEVNNKKVKELIVGFTYWKRVLKYLNVSGYRVVDLEEYFSQTLQKDQLNLTMPEVLLRSVMDVVTKVKHGAMNCFYKLCKRIDCLEKAKNLTYDTKANVENVEVFSSFRPFVSATFSAEKLEQVTLSSESDSEPEETGRSFSRKVGTTARSISSQSEPRIASQSEPSISSQSEPSISSQSEPSIASQSEPSISSQSEPRIASKSEPSISSQSEPSISSQSEPSISSQSEPSISSQSEPSISSQSEPSISSQFEPSISSQFEPSISTQSVQNISSQSELITSLQSELRIPSQSKARSSSQPCINKKMCHLCSLHFKTAGLLRRHMRLDHGGSSSVG